MKVLLALNALGIGGTESYVFTVAEQLDRLAHEAVIFSPEPGQGLEVAHERGLPVIGPGELADDFDVAFVQDAAVAYDVADACPRARVAFAGHSETFDPQSPPQLPGVVAVSVAFNDRVEQRLRSFATKHEVVRLRQPIDTERFVSGPPLPEVPQRALLLSNNIVADREAMLEEACREAGLQLVRVGGSGRQIRDPREALMGADVVIGYGRAILEAMACGRAAFVYDWAGGQGWMTAESYPAIEAGGFGGRNEPVFDVRGLAAAFADYDRSMGPVNHDLVMAHHRANVHVQQLVEIFERLAGATEPPEAPLADMARLVRLEWRARAEVHGLRAENAGLHERLHEIGSELTAAREERGSMQAELTGERAAREEETRELVHRYESTFIWRATAPLRRAWARLRSRPAR